MFTGDVSVAAGLPQAAHDGSKVQAAPARRLTLPPRKPVSYRTDSRYLQTVSFEKLPKRPNVDKLRVSDGQLNTVKSGLANGLYSLLEQLYVLN
ncbi:MAG: hypothetical protein K0S39_45 [Paenibacillus sp.]|nr:hypothetical protein [Paenibacillus sp.]